jgi:hypothetical protein
MGLAHSFVDRLDWKGEDEAQPFCQHLVGLYQIGLGILEGTKKRNQPKPTIGSRKAKPGTCITSHQQNRVLSFYVFTWYDFAIAIAI